MGAGLAEKAKADRRETYLRIQQEGADRRQKSTQEHSEGLIRSVVTGDDREMYGVTGGGDKIKLGIKDFKSMVDGLGLSVDDARLVKTITDAETTGVGSMEGVTVNRENIAQRLIDRGRPDLAKLVGPMEAGSPGAPKMTRAEAEERAKAEASSKNPWLPDSWRPDAMEKAYGPNTTEEEWITQRTEELLTGGGKAAAPAAKQTPAKTVDSQYKTEAEVRDAFRSGALTRDQAAKILREQFGNE